MTIQSGTALGPYEILSRLGAGGMGEVWRARDTRLDREVAIKILPEGFAQNEEFRARFEREAKLISSLNHPNICTLFDVGHEGDTHFLVMELIEGESLAERLERGPLPPSEVLRYGAQIADALDRAHRQGIVHRDLKPGNVMLTQDGAKLLDFGLARPVSETSVVQGMSQMATQAGPLTTEGTIVGTFQYMAPEQLEGTESDARTDIFALGALLFQMATSRPAFEGGTKTSLIAAIVSTDPPPISSVTRMSPPALDHVVRHCLQKNPDDRWQSAHDVASQLRWIDEAGSQAGVATAVVTTRRKRRHAMAVAAIMGWVVAAGALIGWVASRDAAPRAVAPVFRAELVPPPGVSIRPVQSGNVVLSPQGDRVAFGVDDDGSRLMVRDLASGRVATLEGTEGAIFPFWSPDGRWLAFFADEKLKKIEAGGGPVQILADAHAGRGGTWAKNGTIVFAADIRGPLRRVSENGGAEEPVTNPASEGLTNRMPHFLPDGSQFLFIERETRNQAFGNIVAGSVDTDETRTVVERASNPQYADGYLFFVRDGNLMAQSFDPASLALAGPLIPLADGIEYYNPRDIGNYSVSAAGVLVYRERSERRTQLSWFDVQGRELQSVGDPDYLSGPGVSSDGSLVVVERTDASGANSDIWVMDLERQQLTRSTFLSTSGGIDAVFSRDGKRLAVSSFVGAGWAGSAVWIQNVSGSGAPEPIVEGSSFIVSDWSRDGTYLLGTVQETETAHDIAYVELDDSPEIQKLVATRFTEGAGRFSSNGAWVAYSSDETGRPEVYVTDFPGGQRKWQVSTSTGTLPRWSPDGRELYYVNPTGLFAASITSGESLVIGNPRRVMDVGLPSFRDMASSPLAFDGERFLALRFTSADIPEPLRMIRNWKAELER